MNNQIDNESVDKAWIFGSFSRNEEDRESDIDLLIKFSKNKKITLFYYLRLKIELEELTGRNVDLIEDGQLKQFAIPGFDKDKILIYERGNQG